MHNVFPVCSDLYSSSGYHSVNETEDFRSTIEETYNDKVELQEEMNITQSMTVKEIIDNDNGEITKEDIKMAEYLYQEDKLREEEPTRPEYEPKIEIAKM